MKLLIVNSFLLTLFCSNISVASTCNYSLSSIIEDNQIIKVKRAMKRKGYNLVNKEEIANFKVNVSTLYRSRGYGELIRAASINIACSNNEQVQTIRKRDVMNGFEVYFPKDTLGNALKEIKHCFQLMCND